MAASFANVAVSFQFHQKVRHLAFLKGKKMYQVCDEWLIPVLDEQIKKHPTKGTQHHGRRGENEN